MWIKICGIRTVANAWEVIACGPDAIGLNFYAASPRFVTRDVAKAIVQLLPAHIEPVGLFVNEAVDTVVETCQNCGLKTVQLHGDETPQYVARLLAELPELQVIRVCRLGSEGFDGLRHDQRECAELGVSPWRYLVDAYDPEQYGGSGKTVSWPDLANWCQANQHLPLILAGGLTSTNVANAIRTVQPWGVDVASGVESAAGLKDPKQVAAFIKNAAKPTAFE